MPMLVGARFIQGLGAGAIPPIAYVAIGRSLPEPLRPRMFATLSTAWVLPGVIGPAIAGVVGEAFGWRLVFLGLLPLIAIAGALTLRAVSRGRAARRAADRRRPPRPPPSDAACRLPWRSPSGAGLLTRRPDDRATGSRTVGRQRRLAPSLLGIPPSAA